MSFSRFPARFGKYILLDRINSGGMAEVYRAKVIGVEKFQRLVAIKCMLPTLNEDEQFTTMFIDEAKLAAQLSHANVVQIHELGRIDEQLYIAMELINGLDLKQIIRRLAGNRTRMPIGFAAHVMAKAAEGLDFAHRKIGIDGTPLGLVHRDVSPQNILVSFDGEVKVVDFGIAKAKVRDTETRAGVLKGKFAYMAPEQITGGDIDRRTDIFALGAVFYELLTGRKLFRGESDFSILEKVRAAEIPDINRELPDAPAEVQAILKRALARNLEDRYAFASDVAEDLTPLLIDNRSIFGTKQTKELMHSWFAEEIAELSRTLLDYSQVTLESCVESSAAKRRPANATQLFKSTFEGETQGTVRDELTPGLEKGSDGIEDVFEQSSAPAVVPTEVAPADLVATQPISAEIAEVAGNWSSVGSETEVAKVPSSGSWAAGAPTEIAKAPPGGWAAFVQEASGSGSHRSEDTFESGSRRIVTPASRSGSHPGRAVVSQPTPPSNKSRAFLIGMVAAVVVAAAAAITVFLVTRPPDSGSTVVVPLGDGGQPEHTNEVARLGETAGTPQSGAPGLPQVGSAEAKPETQPADEPTSSPGVVVGSAPEDAPDRQDKGKAKAPRDDGRRETFGYLSVKANGATGAKVFIDGKEAGYSPLVKYKLRAGKHKVKIAEEGAGGRAKTIDVTISASDSIGKPAKLIVDL